MRVLLPEIPEFSKRNNTQVPGETVDAALDAPRQPTERFHSGYRGTILIEAKSPKAKYRVPTGAESKFSPDADYCSFLNCGALQSRSCTPALGTTCSESGSAFNDTWPALDVYEYSCPPEQPCSQPAPPPEALPQTPDSRVYPGRGEATPSNGRQEGKGTIRRDATAGQRQAEAADAYLLRGGGGKQQCPTGPPPAALQPIVGRTIGLTDCTMPQISSRVYGGIDGAKDVRDSKKTMFSRKNMSPDSPQSTGPKEILDTIVPKTTIEERLKYVDMEFAQEVEKFVEVPEVFYNDIIVEVPEVVEVVKIVLKEEIRENITYVPRFETKYIPKYVEVPIIKIVDRYEEVDEIQEVLKPVAKKSVVNCPQAVLKKVANTFQKKVITEKPVPIIQHENVSVYRQKLKPKIIKEEVVNQHPYFIDIPVPYEKSVVKCVDVPYFVTRYRDNAYPVPTSHHVTPVFRQGHHTQTVDVPVASPYLITHTSHDCKPPLLEYQVGSCEVVGQTVARSLQKPVQHNVQEGNYQPARSSCWAPCKPIERPSPPQTTQQTVSCALPCPGSCTQI